MHNKFTLRRDTLNSRYAVNKNWIISYVAIWKRQSHKSLAFRNYLKALVSAKKYINLFTQCVVTGTTTEAEYNNNNNNNNNNNTFQLDPAVLKYSCVTMTRYCNVRILLVHCILFVVDSKSVI